MPTNNNISNFFNETYQKIINNIKNKNQFQENDLYYKIKNLSIDARGSFGQQFLVDGLKKIGLKTVNDNNKNKDWDIKVNNYRVEVKTATLDSQNKFQHEGIHKTHNYDLLIFLDIAPNQIFIKAVLYDEIDFSKLHQRGAGRKLATGAGYKWDYYLPQHQAENNQINSLSDLNHQALLWLEKLAKLNNSTTLQNNDHNFPQPTAINTPHNHHAQARTQKIIIKNNPQGEQKK
ncbi:hypothetical protein [Candidatus Phytoplasma pruni]|uniref:Restriction endonuclease n=1 Tax=Candidatus Phytoplasma pruni TaxID=479893 RepID=A0A851HCF9_9MOLU|nr:hypothetical protein [Candidatus Phytoplasma pruni]NWN45755.1 hypothetical protein [Candidatus Phytoplasma pruni]